MSAVHTRTCLRPSALQGRTRAAILAASAGIFYAAVLLATLARHHFDTSIFIVAGDRYVASTQTTPPIIVRPHSAGYDGQFYFAMAQAPFALSRITDGVTLDHPAWRLQRILYPLLAHLLALGHAGFVPAALLAVNVAALAGIAALMIHASRPTHVSLAPAAAVILWPGFLTALTHDTTELVASFFLLASVLAYLRGGIISFAVCGALAALTRETACLVPVAIAALNIMASLRRKPSHHPVPPLRAALWSMAAVLPCLLWHAWVIWHFHGVADRAPVQANLTWPLAGITGRLLQCVTGLAAAGNSAAQRWLTLDTLAVIITIFAFTAWVARAALRLARTNTPARDVAAGWACLIALMATLSARGPWIDSTAILRAFSESWVIGCVLVSLGTPRVKLAALSPLAALAAANVMVCRLNVG